MKQAIFVGMVILLAGCDERTPKIPAKSHENTTEQATGVFHTPTILELIIAVGVMALVGFILTLIFSKDFRQTLRKGLVAISTIALVFATALLGIAQLWVLNSSDETAKDAAKAAQAASVSQWSIQDRSVRSGASLDRALRHSGMSPEVLSPSLGQRPGLHQSQLYGVSTQLRTAPGVRYAAHATATLGMETPTMAFALAA